MSKRTHIIVRWSSVAAMLASLMWAMRNLPTEELTSALQSWIDTLGIWGPVVFSLIYVVATICFVPGVLLTIAAGAIFGLLTGYITVSIGSVVGAACAFLISRYLARSKVEQLAKANPKFGAIDEAISEGGWKVVGLLRLSPAIPFNLQNYLYGLTSIKFWPYVLVSWIAMVPGTLLYIYAGHVAGLAASGEEASSARWILLVVGLLATIAVTIYVTRLARKKLGETEVAEAKEPDEASEPSSKTTWGYAAGAASLLLAATLLHFNSEMTAAWISGWAEDTFGP